MKRFFRPTLTRRIVIATLIAFTIAFVVVAGVVFYIRVQQLESGLDSGRKALAESVIQALSKYKTEQDVSAAAEGIQRMIVAQAHQAGLPSSMHIVVWSVDGARVYASLNMQTQRPALLDSPGVPFSWKGQPYLVASARSDRLLVDVFDTRPMGGPHLQTAKTVLRNISVMMLVTFLFVLMPLLPAVHTGLRPLGILSDALHRRKPDDLSPFASDMRYEELRPLVQAINDLLERLRHKIQQEQSFLHDAAHELQTPLAVIANQTHVLAAASTLDERVEAHRNAEHAIQRAGHLVRQMVVLARLDSDLKDDLKTFNLAAEVRSILAPLVTAALDRSIELTLDSPDQVMLTGDPGALHSIVGNLVDNALRYVDTGNHVQVEIEVVGDRVTLRVADDGPGIRAEDRERIFDRYYRVAGSGVSGSGLGLAIVKQGVNRMHGSIRLTQGLQEKGCMFIVELPTVTR
jgi:signal transduction histidine kinase